MINNFELIKPLFYFNEGNNMFFYCHIKGYNKGKEDVIKTYLIRSRAHLDEIKDEIIWICEHYKARAFINISGKDFDYTNKYLLATLSNSNLSNTISSLDPVKIFERCAMNSESRTKRWLVNVDISSAEEVSNWLNEYFWIEDCRIVGGDGSYYSACRYSTIPLENGVQYITKPFDLEKFTKVFPNVTVSWNSTETLLYTPNSLKILNPKDI